VPHDASELHIPQELATVTLPPGGFLELATSELGTAGSEDDPLSAAVDDLLNNLPDPQSFGDPWEAGIVDIDHARQWIALELYPTTPEDLAAIQAAAEGSYQDVLNHQNGQPPDGSGIPTVTPPGEGGDLQLPQDNVNWDALTDQLVNAVTSKVEGSLPPAGTGTATGTGLSTGTPVKPPSAAPSIATSSPGGLMSVDSSGVVHWFVGTNVPVPVSIYVAQDNGPVELFAVEGAGSGSAPAPWLFSPGSSFHFTMVGNTGSQLDSMDVAGGGVATI
jgi:hypothetical protein